MGIRKMSSAAVGMFMAVSVAALAVADAQEVVPAEAAKTKTRWMPLYARLSIDADGRVKEAVLKTDGRADDYEERVLAQVRSSIVGNLKQWQFEPTLVNGSAMPAVTYANFDVCMIPGCDGFDLKVHYVRVGPLLFIAKDLEWPVSAGANRNPPSSFSVKLKVMADGHAQLQDLITDQRLPPVQPELRTLVEGWIGSMRFHPEMVGGQPIATDILWPFETNHQPFAMRYPTVDKMKDPDCSAARNFNDAPAIDSPVKLRAMSKGGR